MPNMNFGRVKLSSALYEFENELHSVLNVKCRGSKYTVQMSAKEGIVIDVNNELMYFFLGTG